MEGKEDEEDEGKVEGKKDAYVTQVRFIVVCRRY